MRTLECSSKGDRRFSALYAKVSIYGVTNSIENFYQLSKVFEDSEGNIQKFNTMNEVKRIQYLNTHKLKGFYVKNLFIDKKYLSDWYKALWVRYFIENPDLLTVINQYDDFTDIFKKENTINSQADVIKYIRYNGIDKLFSDIKDFRLKIKKL